MKLKIIVDTNIVFSALLNSNSKIGNLLLNSRQHFEFYSCKYLQKEIRAKFQKISKYSKLNDKDLFELINLIESRIFFIDENLLPEPIIFSAKELVKDVDFDDFAFVAITNYINGILWTGDKILIEGLQKKNYTNVITTADLLYLSLKQETEYPI